MFKKIILATAILAIVSPHAFAETAKQGSKLEEACNRQLGDDLADCGRLPGANSVPPTPAINSCNKKAARNYKSCTTFRAGDSGLGNNTNTFEANPNNSTQFDSQN